VEDGIPRGLQHHHKTCCKKGGHCERQAYMFWEMGCSFWMGGLTYDTTRFSDNNHNTNSVLDLVFLCPSFSEFNQHHIHPEWRLSSDHAPITINVSIWEERILHP